mgnify:CR=1 FL=1
MKYYGKICFSVTAEDPDRPGIFTEEQFVERYYYGDVIKLSDYNLNERQCTFVIENLHNNLSYKDISEKYNVSKL